jgi:hypothetical protein
VLVECRGGQETRIDCGARIAGAACVANGDEPYCGFASDCYPAKGSETCQGGTLSFCAAGVVQTIDCVAGGFGGCGSRGCTPRL